MTLTGAGGTGKTRLALQAGGAVADRYPHGVWWVPLASLQDPALVPATAAAVVGATDGLAEQIADRKMLLLFDNFEHVVDAAPEFARLLAACPNLDLLVTTREPLHVMGEQEYAVPPLDHEEAVGLFLARARTVEPDFQADEAVAEICRRLDELPLALELAAARVKVLSSAQILERLERDLAKARSFCAERRSPVPRRRRPPSGAAGDALPRVGVGGLGDRERARTLYEEVLSQARVRGFEHIQTHALEALAELAIRDGRAREAVPLLSDAFRLHRELGDRHRSARRGRLHASVGARQHPDRRRCGGSRAGGGRSVGACLN